MTKLHHKGSAKLPQALDADALLAAIKAFLATCRSPATIEYGEEITRLVPGQYALELRRVRFGLKFGPKRVASPDESSQWSGTRPACSTALFSASAGNPAN